MTRTDSFGWSEEQVRLLRNFVSQKKYFYTEIAPKLGKSVQSVRRKARQLGLPSSQRYVKGRFGQWNSKHKHLRGPVMKYFLTHTMEETRKRFGLTESEVKSILTVGYRLKQFRHLRKDRREKRPFSLNEQLFLLRHAGLRPRTWIMKQMKRGHNVCHVKERLQRMGLSSRTLQGLTLSQFRTAFGSEPAFYLQTDAGPDGRWKIVPWVWLNEEIKAKRLRTAKELEMLISARAMFQEWIFVGNALRKMKRIVALAKREARA